MDLRLQRVGDVKLICMKTVTKWEDKLEKKECSRNRRGVKWLIYVIVKKMRIRDNGKEE
jgi:hypothetical protein